MISAKGRLKVSPTEPALKGQTNLMVPLGCHVPAGSEAAGLEAAGCDPGVAAEAEEEAEPPQAVIMMPAARANDRDAKSFFFIISLLFSFFSVDVDPSYI